MTRYSVFRLEEWFERYEFDVEHLLGSSSCAGMTVSELSEITGEAFSHLPDVLMIATESAAGNRQLVTQEGNGFIRPTCARSRSRCSRPERGQPKVPFL